MPGPSDILTAVQNGVVALNNLALQVQGSLRNISGQLAAFRPELSSDRTYFVRTDGSDANSGLANTSTGALLTWNAAVAKLTAIDTAGHTVTFFNGNAGTYSSGIAISAPWAGGGGLVFDGNLGAITASSVQYAFAVSQGIVLPAPVAIQNITLSGQVGVYHLGLGAVTVSCGTNFGACAFTHVRTESVAAKISFASTGYTISGGALQHMLAAGQSVISNFTPTITHTSAAAYSQFAQAFGAATLTAFGSTFVNSSLVTGSRYDVQSNGIINTLGSGVNYFPGTTPGTSATQGLYL